MKKFASCILRKSRIVQWTRDESATAATEAVILLPVLVTLLMVCFDLGQGITTNQKIIAASQIMGDLIARNRTLTYTNVQDIIDAGELAIAPYNQTPFGYDIVSIQFNTLGKPVVLWRVTQNTVTNDAALTSAEDIGTPGDGLIIVTTTYKYAPLFSKIVTGPINMKEVAFLHARRSATVTCANCPAG